MEKNIRNVEKEGIEVSYIVPTVTCNRFLVTTAPDYCRIAFGESAYPDSPIHYRVAVGMTIWEAEELRDILDTLLKQYADNSR